MDSNHRPTDYELGAKTFFVRRLVNGRDMRVTIDRYGVLTVEEARGKARKLLERMREGIDPVRERRHTVATYRLWLSVMSKASRSIRSPPTITPGKCAQSTCDCAAAGVSTHAAYGIPRRTPRSTTFTVPP